MAEVVTERGFAAASTGVVSERARVSRRTFEELFAGPEECLTAIFDIGRERSVELVIEAFSAEDTWQDGVRAALASLMVFLDSEPLLARVWLVESLAAGAWALEYRRRSLLALRDLIVSSWPAYEGWSPPPLVAEGVIAAVLGIMHEHIVSEESGPLIELLGPLMGTVARHYMSQRAVEHEIERAGEFARKIRAGEHPGQLGSFAQRQSAWSGTAVPTTLSNPNAHRARRCLPFLAGHPDASNREIATGIGVVHQSQISKLLGDLHREGLVVKHAGGAGKRNAWRLTPRGQEIVRTLSAQGAIAESGV